MSTSSRVVSMVSHLSPIMSSLSAMTCTQRLASQDPIPSYLYLSHSIRDIRPSVAYVPLAVSTISSKMSVSAGYSPSMEPSSMMDCGVSTSMHLQQLILSRFRTPR